MTSSRKSMPDLKGQHSPHGIHITMECGGCSREILEDAVLLKETMISCAEEGGATVVDSIIHSYNPAGLSGVVVIAESHLAIHTWPTIGYASFDIYTCGRRELAEEIAQRLEEAFEAKETTRKVFERRPPCGELD
ncbi:MAG: S-adenosylmethionine decarboxylase proenzyme [Akkermansiaceae bacterium]|jgi:S-adenosylmethionine decarboxylase proenzyme